MKRTESLTTYWPENPSIFCVLFFCQKFIPNYGLCLHLEWRRKIAQMVIGMSFARQVYLSRWIKTGDNLNHRPQCDELYTLVWLYFVYLQCQKVTKVHQEFYTCFIFSSSNTMFQWVTFPSKSSVLKNNVEFKYISSTLRYMKNDLTGP